MKRIDLSFLPPLLIVILIIAFSILFNLSIIDVRMQELDRTLARIAYQQDLNKSLNMLAKYSIIKRRMERGYEDSEDYTIESKVIAVITSDFLRDKPRSLSAWNYVYPVVRIGINVIRLFMGKTIVNESQDEADNKELEVAYFYERNRRYEKALAIYNSIIKAKKHRPTMAAYIILHKGFCESMIGNIDEARTSYENIIGRFPDSETAMVAWKLLEFINTLDDELKEAREAPKINSMAYGKRLYLLMDYKNAITVFTNLEKGGRAVAPEALFLKGRCHEELGETALALENYRQILSKYGKSSWAKEANRRMYILGQFYERDKQITELALKRLEEYRDERFFNELSSFTGILKETKVTDDLRVKQRKTVREALNKQNVDVLELIENIDLTGAKADKEAEALEEARQRKTKDLNAGKLDPNMHPLRKPSFIAREITRKCVPLQSTYNRMLRSEKPFAGTLRLVFYIESDGRTSKVEISRDSDVLNQKFNAFVLEQVKDWRFPKIEDRYLPLKVTYPILFTKNH